MKYSESDFNNKTILITGGAGFIGSNLAFYFQENYPNSKVIVFDCFRNEVFLSNGNLSSFGHYKNLLGFNGDIICGDIRSIDDLNLLQEYKFDYIFHFAAISDTRVYDQEIIMKSNVNSFYNILKIAKRDKATIVYASSAAVYGSLSAPQTIGKENPENPYGYSKYVMDKIALNFLKSNKNMFISGIRFFNVYGPKEFYKDKTASMVIQLGHQILNGNAPRLFEGSKKIFRDFIYIEDAIQVIVKACSSKQNGLYNAGTGIPRSFQDISDILQKELKTSIGNEYFPNPFNGYQMNTKADISKTKELGYRPMFTLEEGIKNYLPEIKRLLGEENS